MVLPLCSEFARARGIPIAVVPGRLSGFGIAPAELPVSSLLVQNQRHGKRPFRRRCVKNNHSVLAGRKVVQSKDGRVAGLALAAENAATKFRPRKSCRPPRDEQKGRTRSRLGRSQRGLVLSDPRLNAGKIRGQAWNRALPQRGRVSFGDQSEVAKSGGGERGARGVLHFIRGLATFCEDTRCGKGKKSQHGTKRYLTPVPKHEESPAFQQAFPVTICVSHCLPSSR